MSDECEVMKDEGESGAGIGPTLIGKIPRRLTDFIYLKFYCGEN